jgi:hypothetical protein
LSLGTKLHWWQTLACRTLVLFHFLSSSPIFMWVARWQKISGSAFAPPELPNFAGGSNSLPHLGTFPFLYLINPLITMYKHNRCWGNTSRNQSCNVDLSIYGPQVGWLHYHDGDNGGSGGTRRYALIAR